MVDNVNLGEHLPVQESGCTVSEFIVSTISKPKEIEKYLSSVVKETVSVDRFEQMSLTDLPTDIRDCEQYVGNPLPKPARVTIPFGKFTVTQFDQQANHSSSYNPAKSFEYNTLY